MIKKYLILIMFLVLIIVSCEEPQSNVQIATPTITILSPENDNEFILPIYILDSLNNPIDSLYTIPIIANIENKESVDLAYILVNDNIIASGLSDQLNVSYQPSLSINQTINIEAQIVNFLDDTCKDLNENECLVNSEDGCKWSGYICYSENIDILATDNSTITINPIDIDPFIVDPVFMDVNEQFSMMRFPVTNREFIYFLNTNKQINVEIVDILWTNIGDGDYGDPTKCEFDAGDNYEPTEWWYVNVTAPFGNQDIPSDNYSIYKNGYNIYDINADYGNQGGKIRYNCSSGLFYLPDEEDGSESIYLDHPVTGVSWVGANIYANYFGWSIPSLEQWNLAAKNDYQWEYPWGNTINLDYANYNNSTTTRVGHYNGLGDLNLSLSAFGMYDMAGNVWEHTNSLSVPGIYKKTGGAFDSDTTQLKIGYFGYSLFEQVSNNTGFRCVTDVSYPSSPASGCVEENKCNYDMFAQVSSSCYEDDCLGICGGDAQEYEFFEDLDNDGFGAGDPTLFCEGTAPNQWVDNNYDLDDNCESSDINQNEIDCNDICNGEAYIDGCGECVGGDTGETECNEDCNGVNGGSAERDDCDVCSGGDTGLEPNQDLDCNGICDPSTSQGQEDLNNGFEYGAYIDDCGYCVGGGTGLEENFADLGCGCNEPESKLYCLDTDNNGCCDCGNNDDGQWDECDESSDVDSICENDLTGNYIESILGCSNENAENWYCDEQDNQCIDFFGNIIPPCNFIDNGSCLVYGCSDPNALNYIEGATECEDGSNDSCCEYADDIEPDVFISFGIIDEQAMEILIDTPNYDVSGFQFNITGANLTSGTGGLAADAGFTVSTGGETVIGFSFSGGFIPAGSNGILTNLNYTPTDTNACFYLGTGAFTDNSVPPVELGAQFGNEPETDPDTIDPVDDCIQLP